MVGKKITINKRNLICNAINVSSENIMKRQFKKNTFI